MIAKNIIYGLVFTAVAGLNQAIAQVAVPAPKEHFGFNIGDDYHLATYTQTESYFKKLAASNRTKLVDIGLTEEGRHQYMLVVSSPENIKKLEQYKKVSQQLAHADNLTDEQAHALAATGKPVIWIDGGLHATETVGAHQLIETAYQLVSRNDAETKKILDDVIILLVHCNPDGQEIVSNWYMQNQDVKKRDTRIPVLYQKYIGHDNNRDFYMMNMKETQNMSRQQYVEWMPQIVYNHHQTGPPGSVLAGPPYRDPFNFNYDPLVITSLDGVGAAMNNRLSVEGKPGYTQRAGSNYSTWWNGGLRTTPYFHNMIGILTEIIGGPTPAEIPLVPDRLIPNGATPYPVLPQTWHFRQSIDYSVSLNYAVLNYAVRNADDLLFNLYKMGKNSIERGSKDNWTLSPKRVAAIKAAQQVDQKKDTTKGAAVASGRSATVPMKYFDAVLKNPELRDARAYVISADQSDFPTAVKFINALIYSGVYVHKATAPFSIEGKSYPAGSFVVKTDQAFRPHVMDMFEPQDHPNDFQYPGGPPVRPYDVAGWTLAYQMGVKFDRILTGFEAPLTRIEPGKLQVPAPQKVTTSSAGYLLSPEANNSFLAVNDLLKAGVAIQRITKAQNGMPEGSFYVPAKGMEILKTTGLTFGTVAKPVSRKPNNTISINKARIALFDQYGGSIPSGWARWIMEQFHYTFDVVYPKDIDKGDLNAKYDLILFIDGGIPAVSNTSSEFRGQAPKEEEIPEAYRARLGSITAAKSVPLLKSFMENGGNIVTVGSSTNLAYHLGLPVKNALVEVKADGAARPLPGDKFYIPGSILKVTIDNKQPVNWGMAKTADVIFDNSPVFTLTEDAKKQNILPLAWYGDEDPLRSGWAWGQSYLKNGVAAFVAPIGKGKLYAFGPEITFRAQSQGTFKMLFNDLYKTK
jgi:hypothetical protein